MPSKKSSKKTLRRKPNKKTVVQGKTRRKGYVLKILRIMRYVQLTII